MKRTPNLPPRNTLYYGLTAEEWMEMFRAQGSVCPICEHGDRFFVTDHEHVRGWKKMDPSERRLYVRGIVCAWCNRRVLNGGVTKARLINAVAYLEAYERHSSKSKVTKRGRGGEDLQRPSSHRQLHT